MEIRVQSPETLASGGRSWSCVVVRGRSRVRAWSFVVVGLLDLPTSNTVSVTDSVSDSDTTKNKLKLRQRKKKLRQCLGSRHVGPPTAIFWGTDLSAPQRRYAGEPTGQLPNARYSRPVGSPTAICWGADRSAPQR